MSKMMKRGIFMFLLLLAVSIGIIYYTIDLDALKAISSFNSISLLLALVALVAGMYFDGLRLQRLVKIGGYKLSIRAVLRVIFSNYFMAMLTPGASGGLSQQPDRSQRQPHRANQKCHNQQNHTILRGIGNQHSHAKQSNYRA